MIADLVKNKIRGWLKSTPYNKKENMYIKKGLSCIQKKMIVYIHIYADELKKTALPKIAPKCYREGVVLPLWGHWRNFD